VSGTKKMSEVKKRRLQELEQTPLIVYQFDARQKFHKIFDLLDKGNVRLYCESNGIEIATGVLDNAGIFFIKLPCLHCETPASCQICIDHDTFLHVFRHIISPSGAIELKMEIYEDFIIISSFDEHRKMLANGRIAAMAEDEIDILKNRAKDVEYSDSIVIAANKFSDRLPTGKELHFRVEKEYKRLCITTKTEVMSLNGFVSMKESRSDYRETFGELGTKLFRKVVDVYDSNKIRVEMEDGNPIHIVGSLDFNETIEFYLAGIATED